MTDALIDATLEGPRWTAESLPASWTRAVETPDLLGVFEDALHSTVESRATVEELIAWALRQAFEPDRAERIEREAWGEADDA